MGTGARSRLRRWTGLVEVGDASRHMSDIGRIWAYAAGAPPPATLDRAVRRRIVTQAGGLLAALDSADRTRRAALYDKLGIEGIDQPTQRLVVVTADLVCQWLVSEGRYTHTLRAATLSRSWERLFDRILTTLRQHAAPSWPIKALTQAHECVVASGRPETAWHWDRRGSSQPVSASSPSQAEQLGSRGERVEVPSGVGHQPSLLQVEQAADIGQLGDEGTVGAAEVLLDPERLCRHPTRTHTTRRPHHQRAAHGGIGWSSPAAPVRPLPQTACSARCRPPADIPSGRARRTADTPPRSDAPARRSRSRGPRSAPGTVQLRPVPSVRIAWHWQRDSHLAAAYRPPDAISVLSTIASVSTKGSTATSTIRSPLCARLPSPCSMRCSCGRGSCWGFWLEPEADGRRWD